jgi:non-reducing end alpha-L-arabinofuranosidase
MERRPARVRQHVAAMLKNTCTSRSVLKGSDAQSDGLTTVRDGGLPCGYRPVQKQGAVILGIGVDRRKRGGSADVSEGTCDEGAT